MGYFNVREGDSGCRAHGQLHVFLICLLGHALLFFSTAGCGGFISIMSQTFMFPRPWLSTMGAGWLLRRIRYLANTSSVSHHMARRYVVSRVTK